MNFLFDNNLSPVWPRALEPLSNLLDGDDVQSVVHLKDRFDRSASDEQWLAALAKEGHWAVVSSDGFRKSDAEKALIRGPAWPYSSLRPHGTATLTGTPPSS